MEPMEEFFARRFALRRSGDGRAVAGEITFTPDLQGPPDRGHGGGVAAACLRVAAEVLGQGRMRPWPAPCPWASPWPSRASFL